jgi:quinohemoprotein ethanol dehydrogenase
MARITAQMYSIGLLLAGTSLLLTACQPADEPKSTGMIINEAALSNETNGTNWASYGRTYSEQHYSPLEEISDKNIDRLGLVWSLELGDIPNGATVPLAVDGVLYFTVGQSIVHAVNALNGKLLWKYDPEAWKLAGMKLRHSWGARGIAFWKGKVFVGTTDGRLIAINAKTGKVVWSQMTVGKDNTSAITGAPRVFNGTVIIGQAGADVTALRGYVTAFDAETGKQRWRFYTAPGNPADGFEDEAQAMAAKTWSGEWWKLGGGANVWNAITYDPEFDTVYLGTGNGVPWNQKIRSPGGGDNLFISSIVALDARTGKYKWHYQEVPENTWDYNSVMDMTLADITIDGKQRKVIVHAPKNGFLYVIDRESGKPISAEKFSLVTWADRIDMTTGRPVVNPGMRFDGHDTVIRPASSGAHSWQPQSFSPKTGLVYIPTMQLEETYTDKHLDLSKWSFKPGQTNTGVQDYDADGPGNAGKTTLLAWDPVKQKKAWEIVTPGFWNGGTMASAGNLVFQGVGRGFFHAYSADSGKKLWSFNAMMGINGAPISYQVQGRQYITVIAGWGAGGAGYMGTMAAQEGWVSRIHNNRVLTFALDGKAKLPKDLPPPQMVEPIYDKSFRINEQKARDGRQLFARTCFMCHGVGAVAGGYAPDLRSSPIPLDPHAFEQVVRAGILEERNMPKYAELNDADLENLRHYIRWAVYANKTSLVPASR